MLLQKIYGFDIVKLRIKSDVDIDYNAMKIKIDYEISTKLILKTIFL